MQVSGRRAGGGDRQRKAPGAGMCLARTREARGQCAQSVGRMEAREAAEEARDATAWRSGGAGTAPWLTWKDGLVFRGARSPKRVSRRGAK